MGRAVLLLHRLEDGSSHFDWMIQRRGPDGPLLTFRLGERPDAPPPRGPAMRAERIGDHRAAYLEHQGPIGGGRGSVSRIAAGELRVVEESPPPNPRIVLAGWLGAARGVWRGEGEGGGSEGVFWFTFVPGADGVW